MKLTPVLTFFAGLLIGALLHNALSSKGNEQYPVPPISDGQRLPDKIAQGADVSPGPEPAMDEIRTAADTPDQTATPASHAVSVSLPTNDADPETKGPLTLDDAKALVERSFVREDSVALFKRQFKLALGSVRPSVTPAQREEIINYLERRAREYLLPELASIRFSDRLDKDAIDQAIREQYSYLRGVRLYISTSILRPDQASSLPSYWRQ